MDSKFVLGYWGIRGRGQVLRHLLAYSGLEWEDKVYTGPEKWFGNGDKQTLGMDFPNLPYLTNGEFKLSESVAIAKYIIKKSNKKELVGKDEEDEARVDMIISLLDDIYSPTYALFFSPRYAEESERLFNGKIKEKLDQLKAFIGEKQFTLGYLTLADFRIAEAAYYFEKLYEKQIGDYPFFGRIRQGIESLPEVKAYYEREGAVKGPFMPNYSQLKFWFVMSKNVYHWFEIYVFITNEFNSDPAIGERFGARKTTQLFIVMHPYLTLYSAYYVDESKFTFDNIDNLRNISGHLLKATLIRHKLPDLPPNTSGNPNSEKNTI